MSDGMNSLITLSTHDCGNPSLTDSSIPLFILPMYSCTISPGVVRNSSTYTRARMVVLCAPSGTDTSPFTSPLTDSALHPGTLTPYSAGFLNHFVTVTGK